MTTRKKTVLPAVEGAAPGPAPTMAATLTRTLGPAIPLAVALVGGMLGAGSKTTAPVTAPAPIVMQTGQSASSNSLSGVTCGGVGMAACDAPYPMLTKGHPVDWWFVFKMNAAIFPKCGGGVDGRACPFGDSVQPYSAFGQQYVYASAEAPTLADGSPECLGDGTGDPVGATFDEVYNGNYHYLVWNDQPYGDPTLNGCSGGSCGAPWGHSKGMLAWNDAGVGFVMQVSTPDWPGSGSKAHPRASQGNTLGCVKDDNVKVSQHFFALRLTEPDLVAVLGALKNASVVTDPKNPQLANVGGPAEVVSAVNALGPRTGSTTVVNTVLSSGVRLIGKPSALNVPPWQMVSSVLGGAPLRAATWWETPEIPSTTADTVVGCWSPSLPNKPGPVEIATAGTWEGKVFALTGGLPANGNHAKIGVSTSGTPYAIFGDENQQGALSGNCGSSQNGRGGMFFVMQNQELVTSMTSLLAGTSAPVAP